MAGRSTLTDEHSDSLQLEEFIGSNKMFSGRTYRLPIPVAARSKAWVCGRSLAGTAHSNTAGDMDVCPL